MEPKKLILSRKGFDSASGGCPQPYLSRRHDVFVTDTLRRQGSIRRPSTRRDRHRNVVKGITGGRLGEFHLVHLDPDLNFDAYRHRQDRAGWEEWRGMLGQAGAAEGHLSNQGVASGDVFLFFGFTDGLRKLLRAGALSEDPRNYTSCGGWLQVDEKHLVTDIGPNDLPWARHHPHIFSEYGDGKNTVYAASMKLDLGGASDRPKSVGWGVFPRFDQRLVLTNPDGAGVSHWRLPRWFYPDDNKPPLTYHLAANAGGVTLTKPTCRASEEGRSSCWTSLTTLRPRTGCMIS